MPNGGWIALFVVASVAGIHLWAWAWSKQKPKGYDLNRYHERGKR